MLEEKRTAHSTDTSSVPLNNELAGIRNLLKKDWRITSLVDQTVGIGDPHTEDEFRNAIHCYEMAADFINEAFELSETITVEGHNPASKQRLIDLGLELLYVRDYFHFLTTTLGTKDCALVSIAGLSKILVERLMAEYSQIEVMGLIRAA